MNETPSRRTGWLIAWTVTLGLAGAVIAYVGTRDTSPTPAVNEATTQEAVGTGPVYSIVLPHDEPILPVGPHRELFQASCTVCHSTRLPLSQPPFNEKQWTGVVDKMVKVYGAPLTLTQQREVIAYLVSLPGSKQVQAFGKESTRPAYAQR